jgi:hypothetical protein
MMAILRYMKKWLLAGCIGFLILLTAIYVFIPSTLVVIAVVPIKCNVNGADRFLRDSSNPMSWLPDAKAGGIRYEVGKRFLRMVEIRINDGRESVTGGLSVFPKADIDSAVLQWKLSLHASHNPIKRIGQYQEAGRLQAEMEVVLTRLRSTLEDQTRVYGIAIRQTSITDSAIVSTKNVYGEYPSTAAIYELVDKLRLFILSHGGQVSSYLMLNVNRETNGQFQVEVALPTDKVLQPNGNFRCKVMIHGKYLEADVRGGNASVDAALDQMRNYISDYQRTVMAIPFQYLVTDRRSEPDTTKWLTKLYYPVF